MAERPLSAALRVWMPLAIESISEFRSPARLLRPLAVNQLLGLSRAEFTLLPVARRFCVEAIMSAVPLRESRFERTAFEREISAIGDSPFLGLRKLQRLFLRHPEHHPAGSKERLND